MARSDDTRHPLRFQRGVRRYHDIGGHVPPGDDGRENSRDHNRIWFELRNRRSCCCDPNDPGFRYCIGEKKDYPTMICAEEFLTGATLLDYWAGGGNNDNVINSWYLTNTCGGTARMYSEPFGSAVFVPDGSWRNGPFVWGMSKPGLTQNITPWWQGNAWLNSPNSFEFWIKPSPTDIAQGKQLTSSGPFIGMAYGGYYTGFTSGGGIYFQQKDTAGGVAQVSANGIFTGDQWHHVVYVRRTTNGGSFAIYVNGSRVLNVKFPYPASVDPSNPQLAWGTGAQNSHWADLARYSGAISGQTIWRHYRSMAEDYGLTPPGEEPPPEDGGGGGVTNPGDFIFDLPPDRIDGEGKEGYVMMSDGDTGLWESPENSPFELEARKGAASGYAALDSTTKVPAAQLGTGTADKTVFLRGDRVWRKGRIVPPPEAFDQVLIAGAGYSDDYVAAIAALSPYRYWKLLETGNPPASFTDAITATTGTPTGDPRSVTTDPAFYGESSIEFDADDYLNLSILPDTDNWAMTFWLRIDSLPASTVRLVEAGLGGNGVGVNLNADGTLQIFAEGRHTTNGATALVPGRWYHVAASWRGNIFGGSGFFRRIWVDGVLDVQVDNSITPWDIYGGGRVAGDGFLGRIAHLASWARELTPTEVATLYPARYVDWVPYTGSLGGGVEASENGVDATAAARPRINFIEGANVALTVADDAGNDEIDVTIAATSPAGAGIEVDKNDADVTAAPRGRLNFIEGANVALTVADDGANDEVDITVAATDTKGIEVSKNDADVSAARRNRINFKEGANVTLTVTDDGADDEVEVTIAAADTNTVGIEASENGVDATAARRSRVNFIAGANVTVDVADDPGNDEIDVTIAAAGGGGGGAGIEASKNGADVTAAARGRINLIEGSGVTLTVADDALNDEIDVTIAATGGGGGSSDPLFLYLIAR